MSTKGTNCVMQDVSDDMGSVSRLAAASAAQCTKQWAALGRQGHYITARPVSVQDALDSVEFVSGPADSKWGSVRASMGHPEPWSLNFLAIGNEVRLLFPQPCMDTESIAAAVGHDRMAVFHAGWHEPAHVLERAARHSVEHCHAVIGFLDGAC